MPLVEPAGHPAVETGRAPRSARGSQSPPRACAADVYSPLRPEEEAPAAGGPALPPSRDTSGPSRVVPHEPTPRGPPREPPPEPPLEPLRRSMVGGDQQSAGPAARPARQSGLVRTSARYYMRRSLDAQPCGCLCVRSPSDEQRGLQTPPMEEVASHPSPENETVISQ